VRIEATDRSAPDGRRVHLIYLEDSSGFDALVGLLLEKDGLYGSEKTTDRELAARRVLADRATAVTHAVPCRPWGAQDRPPIRPDRPGKVHLHSVHVLVEPSGHGDWQAEACTMDDLGVNIVNYNPDSPDDAADWLKRGLLGLGIFAGSYTVEVKEDDDEEDEAGRNPEHAEKRGG
jgi:hypothetical protein